ncbi:FMN-binding negative transcriptional regulator [Sphingopyxis sp. MSC1_008]|jgi:transcriptional regulator|uniref:FMN-binding negative transcriptional regulator n=1 Tax=Sphingopyxis sp. MSC1_008 TaxID=2909265 RepID=UPI0020C03368|nr:FMN-binding negative transcriptional regulator [Sphingopyxis sp. MSC1_008]
MSIFERLSAGDVRALIEAYPLAWVCAAGEDGIEASLLPLVGRYDEDGMLIELIGHLMRTNPLHALLKRRPQAMILFKGPDAYVSPEHAGKRDWAPTWNFAQARVGAEIAFGESFTGTSLDILIDAMEAGRAEPWTKDELGPRYQEMVEQIVGFRARVTSVSNRFKLGQDEQPEVLRTILESLPDAATTQWMQRFNTERLRGEAD